MVERGELTRGPLEQTIVQLSDKNPKETSQQDAGMQRL